MPLLVTLVVAAGLVALVVAVWHITVLLATLFARLVVRTRPGAPLIGIRNLRVVDDRVWRGARPDVAAYRGLAEHGVTTVIDLREELSTAAHELRALGLAVSHVPVVDGALPTPDQISEALAVIQRSTGCTYIHCAAGVGRTGTVIASYLRAAGVSRWRTLLHNLSVGASSLEQTAFVFTAPRRPHRLVIAGSRFLDAPRVYLGKGQQWLRSRL